MASCAGVQIRFMAASIPISRGGLLFHLRGRRASPLGTRIGAPTPHPEPEGNTMKISMHACLGGRDHQHPRQPLLAAARRARRIATSQQVRPERAAELRAWRPTCCRSRARCRSPCDIAKNSVARLAGQEPPRFEDNETTIEQLRARIARTIDYMQEPAGERVRRLRNPRHQGARRRAHARVQGTGLPAAWAIPNVFFHVTTAYNILRHNGVELGKRDFIGGGRKL